MTVNETFDIYFDVSPSDDELKIPTVIYVKQLIDESLPNMDTLVDVFNSSDPSPSSAEALTLRTDFEFSDEHLMSSLAVKMLLDKLEKRIAALEQS